MHIIKIKSVENNFHPYEFQSHRNACWEDGCIAVPEALVDKVVASGGYCDLDIRDGQLVDIIPTEKPVPTAPAYTDQEVTQQAITDLELSDIVQGQAITDLEIMILEGQAHV